MKTLKKDLKRELKNRKYDLSGFMVWLISTAVAAIVGRSVKRGDPVVTHWLLIRGVIDSAIKRIPTDKYGCMKAILFVLSLAMLTTPTFADDFFYTPTPVPSDTPTFTSSWTPSISPTPTRTFTGSPTTTPSSTPSISWTPTRTPSNTPTPTRTPSATPSSSPTATWTASPVSEYWILDARTPTPGAYAVGNHFLDSTFDLNGTFLLGDDMWSSGNIYSSGFIYLSDGGLECLGGVLAHVDIDANRDMGVGRNLDVAGTADINGTLLLGGDIWMGGNLTSAGFGIFVGDLDCYGPAGFHGDAEVGEDLSVVGDASVDTGFSVGGESSFTGYVSMDDDLEVAGDIACNDFGASGNAQVDLNINIAGWGNVGGDLAAGSDLSVADNATIAKNIYVGDISGAPKDASAVANFGGTTVANVALITGDTSHGRYIWGDMSDSLVAYTEYDHFTNEMLFYSNNQYTGRILATGNWYFGNGTNTPDTAVALDDVYVEGNLEADLNANFTGCNQVKIPWTTVAPTGTCDPGSIKIFYDSTEHLLRIYLCGEGVWGYFQVDGDTDVVTGDYAP